MTTNAEIGQLPFGAVVVDKDDVILGTGVNRQLGDGDPFAHAEVSALEAAWGTAGAAALHDAVLVSSCEPCALCLAAAATVGVARILYAATRDDVFGLGEPHDPNRDQHLRSLADALRAIPAVELIHVPSVDARLPFDTWVRAQRKQR